MKQLQPLPFLFLYARPDKGSFNSAFLIMAFLVIPLFMTAYFRDKKKAVENYIQEITFEYPGLVSKLSLLYSAGMTINRALEKICSDYEFKNPTAQNPLYINLRHTLNRLYQGGSPAEEYKLFGKNCKAPCFLRFGNLLSRNLLKGSSDLQAVLQDEVERAYEAWKQHALKKSGEAGTKMLLPMMMIFVVILIIIMIPALNSVSIN